MRVISRRIGETILINDHTRITITKASPEQAELLIWKLGRPPLEHAVQLRINDRYTVVDGVVSIEIVGIRRVNDESTVRVGIEAPDSVSVSRKEVHDAIMRNKASQHSETAIPAPQIAVAFDANFSADEIQNCLEYLALLYRNEGGVGLRVIGSESKAPELAEVPNGF